MPSTARFAARAAVLRELAAFLRERRLWWLLPMVGVLLTFGVLLVLAQGSAAAPFIYSLF
jgi:NAD/NADP transhydrogenase beta subunit